MSTFRVDIVPVALEPHPNADTLSIIKVFGWNVVGRTVDWTGVEQAAYIPPDSLVDVARPEFSFLANPKYPNRKLERITVKRLRGTYSQGLLVPAPAGSKIGDDVAEQLGVTHYQPPENLSTGGESGPPPKGGFRPVYDIENFNRYGNLLVPGEQVMVTEKLHGASGRFTFYDGALYAGSRTEWKRDAETIIWWKALHACPPLKVWLEANQWATVYGELVGQVQDLSYGIHGVTFRAFDVWNHEKAVWIDAVAQREMLEQANVPVVPLLFQGQLDEASLRNMAEGKSTLADNVREGVVVKPLVERHDPNIGRVQLKLVGNSFLERKEK